LQSINPDDMESSMRHAELVMSSKVNRTPLISAL